MSYNQNKVQSTAVYATDKLVDAVYKAANKIAYAAADTVGDGLDDAVAVARQAAHADSNALSAPAATGAPGFATAVIAAYDAAPIHADQDSAHEQASTHEQGSDQVQDPSILRH